MESQQTKVILAERKSAVLKPSALACISRLPTVNLTAGCAHNCVYCYARGYSQQPAGDAVTLYANTLEMLKHELPRKRKRPVAVYFSPSSDAFQPLPEVLDLAYDVMAYLFSEGIGVAVLTKGSIPPKHLELLIANAGRLHIGIGLTTLDTDIWRALEPDTAPPQQRLDQMAALVRAGAQHQMRLDPIFPGVTDDEPGLRALMDAIADVGVTRIAYGTAFLRKPIIASLKRRVADSDIVARILAHYEDGIWTKLRGAGTAAMIPSVRIRSPIYCRIEALARKRGIETHVCGCKNADMSSDECSIAGGWNAPASKDTQLHFD